LVRATGTVEVYQLAVLDDNYIYVLRELASGQCAAIDPALSQPVEDFLGARRWALTAIWNTHHHADHVGGNQHLKEANGCSIWGAARDVGRIPGLDHALSDGDVFTFGALKVEVLETPGHTTGHIAFHIPEADLLFCGDTLFGLGCGRLFEGTAAEMWQSLTRLRSLAPQTRVLCAHEYTLSNAAYALSLGPYCTRLSEYVAGLRARREKGEPTVPSSLAEECTFNPFLNADSPAMLRGLGLEDCPTHEIFAQLRSAKDRFGQARKPWPNV
jgi:hydroxyacylglutathione hydrolase